MRVYKRLYTTKRAKIAPEKKPDSMKRLMGQWLNTLKPVNMLTVGHIFLII